VRPGPCRFPERLRRDGRDRMPARRARITDLLPNIGGITQVISRIALPLGRAILLSRVLNLNWLLAISMTRHQRMGGLFILSLAGYWRRPLRGPRPPRRQARLAMRLRTTSSTQRAPGDAARHSATGPCQGAGHARARTEPRSRKPILFGEGVCGPERSTPCDPNIDGVLLLEGTGFRLPFLQMAEGNRRNGLSSGVPPIACRLGCRLGFRLVFRLHA
jgi:hypothetical protein